MDVEEIVLHSRLASIEISKLWKYSCPFDVNLIITHEQIWPAVVLGTTDGNLRIFSNKKELKFLETKGGSVLSLALSNGVTNLDDTLEIVAGDADGNVVIFSNEKILYSFNFGAPITFLACIPNIAEHYSIVCGDQNGVLTFFRPFDNRFFRISLVAEMRKRNLPNDNFLSPSPTTPNSVRALLPYHIHSLGHKQCLTSSGDTIAIEEPQTEQVDSFLVVADGSTDLKFFSFDCDRLVNILRFPAPIVCCGNFVPSPPQSRPQLRVQHQLLVACHSGLLYLVDPSLQSFEVYAVVGYSVTQIATLTLPSLALDLVLCIGQFASLKVFQDRKLVTSYPTPEWPVSIAVASKQSPPRSYFTSNVPLSHGVKNKTTKNPFRVTNEEGMNADLIDEPAPNAYLSLVNNEIIALRVI